MAIGGVSFVVVVVIGQVSRKGCPSDQSRDGPAWSALGGGGHAGADGGKLGGSAIVWSEGFGSLVASSQVWLALLLIITIAVIGAHTLHTGGALLAESIIGVQILASYSEGCVIQLSYIQGGRFATIAAGRVLVSAYLTESGWAIFGLSSVLLTTLAWESLTSICGVLSGAHIGIGVVFLAYLSAGLAGLPPVDVLETEAEVVGGNHSDWGGIH